MSSGGYDGLHSSSSYGLGDSWRPSMSGVPAYHKSGYYNHSSSPSRRYALYDGYYPPENSYRPSSYRHEDDDAYYSRSPSPDHYSRTYSRAPEPETWERAEPWGGVSAPWDDPSMGPSSPTSSTSKARRNSMLATRMFEPSESWKQHHVDRPPRIETARPLSRDRYTGEPLGPRTPNSYVSGSNPHAAPALYPIGGDRYRPGQPHGLIPRADSYRPGWSPPSDARRWTPNLSSEENPGRTTARTSSKFRNRQDSGVGSNIGSGSPRRSSPNQPGNTSQSRSRRSSSREPHSDSHSISRGRRSLSRGDRPVSRGRRSPPPGAARGNSSISPEKATSGKFSWDRPNTAPTMASSAKPAKAPAPPLQRNSWTRSDSRSSIASTQASPTPPPTSQFVDNKGPTNVKLEAKPIVISTDVEMASPHSVPRPPASKSASQPMQKLELAPKSAGLPPRPASPLAPMVFGRPSKPAAAALPSPPSPKRPTITVHTQNPAGVDEALKPAAPKAEFRDVQISEKAHCPDIAAPRATVPAPTPVAALSEKAPAQTNTSMVEQPPERRSNTVPTAAALPTPVPTPQPQRALEVPRSPPLPESIPTEAKSIRDALRIVVMTRMLCDRQTREERVNPVLLSNLSIAGQFHEPRTSGKPEDLFKEVTEGPQEERRLETFGDIKHSLVERFKERQERLAEKARCLKEEYLSLHERWLTHCAVLDEQSKPSVRETDTIQPTGRTTRRSAAILGDAVRSDLEMEQIIASLGNDEATDPNYLSLRNLATIPDMISVTHGTVDHYFDDTNHLVENAAEYYGPHTGIHDWTEQEKDIFIDKYAATPKQFGMVAEHLPNKTAAQCVDYYYLHKKKLIDFRKVISQYAPNKRKRRGMGKKKGNALLADIRQHDAEMQGQLESPKTTGRGRGRKPMLPPEPKDPKKPLPSRRRMQLDLTPSAGSATPTPEPESRRRGRRATVSMSRTVSVALEDAEEEAPQEEERPAKRAKRVRKVKSAAIIDDDEPGTPEPELTESISRRKSGTSFSQWSEEDKSLFLTLLGQHGDDFKRIAASMPNKTTIQVSNYYKANMADLDLEKVAAGAPKRSLTPDTIKETPPLPVSTTDLAVSPDPMASLAPDPAPVSTNGAGPSRPAHDATQSHRDVDMRWGSSHYGSASNSRPVSPGQMRSTYPYLSSVPNGRPPPGAHYPPHHPAYVAPPSVPYTYPPYSASHYPHYDTGYDHSRMQFAHPYPMPDPMSGQHVHVRRMAGAMPPGPGVALVRARENPYPILPPGPSPYHYSLESSS